jgi:hypothetical protein
MHAAGFHEHRGGVASGFTAGLLAAVTAAALANAAPICPAGPTRLEAVLSPATIAPLDFVGLDVALTGDTAVVGSARDFRCCSRLGEAYVFARDGVTWLEEATLRAGDVRWRDEFGAAVAASGDTVVVGAPGASIRSFGDGAVYVFVKRGGSWVEEAKLTGSDNAWGDSFGGRVALDGDTLVVGAHLHSTPRPSIGAAYVFRRVADTWVEEAKLTPSEIRYGRFFGIGVAVSGDTVAVGDVSGSGLTFQSGVAYVYVREPDGWHEQARLFADDGGDGHEFGYSVALHDDTLVVGANNAHGAVPGVGGGGSAYVFVRQGSTWAQPSRLSACDGASSDWFGIDVALSGDTVVVGAYGADGRYREEGAAYVFHREGDDWTLLGKLTSPSPSFRAGFGIAVAVDGDTALVGSPLDAVDGTEAGAAFAFACGTPSGCSAGPDMVVECDGVLLSGSVSLSGAAGSLPVRWTSSCLDVVFVPGDDVLDTTVFLGDACRRTCEMTLTVGEPGCAPCRDTATIAIEDTTPPLVVPSEAEWACLWPPSHGYACLPRAQLPTPEASDCHGPVTWRFGGCQSDQPDDDIGDGHTEQDCVVLEGGDVVCLRSERSGTDADGRRYAVAVVATDACGNDSAPFPAGRVHVPHDQAPRRTECLRPSAPPGQR